jgi:hypothetical protein
MTKPEKNQYLFLFRHPQSQAEPSPEEMQKIFGQWMDWMKGMKAQGIYGGGERLDDAGKVVKEHRGVSVTDGPYAESKEVLGGYIIVSADSLDHAAVIAQGCPGLETGCVVEVRPIEPLPQI